MSRSVLAGAVIGLVALLVATESAQAQRFRRGYGGGYGWYGPYYGRGYSYGPYYSGRYYDYGPSYSGDFYATPSNATQSFYFEPRENMDSRTVQLKVLAPTPDTRIWIENQPTQQQGTERVFVSPPLEQGQEYTYKLRAAWMENGREVTQDKELKVQPGRQVTVDLRNRALAQAPQPNQTDEGRDGERNRTFRNRGAGEEASENGTTIAGEIVAIENGLVTIMDPQDRSEHKVRSSTDGQIQLDGQRVESSALKAGMHVSVTLKPGSTDSATKIEARTNRPSGGKNATNPNQFTTPPK